MVGEPEESEKRCGDGVCDGPENGTNCPEDCGEEVEREAVDASIVPVTYVPVVVEGGG